MLSSLNDDLDSNTPVIRDDVTDSNIWSDVQPESFYHLWFRLWTSEQRSELCRSKESVISTVST